QLGGVKPLQIAQNLPHLFLARGLRSRYIGSIPRSTPVSLFIVDGWHMRRSRPLRYLNILRKSLLQLDKELPYKLSNKSDQNVDIEFQWFDLSVPKPVAPYMAVGLSTIVYGIAERKHIK